MIKFPKWDGGGDHKEVDAAPPAEVVLPPAPLLDAGVNKFLELANLNWPKQKGDFSLVRFDTKNIFMLRMTIGLVYMAMLHAERDARGAANGSAERGD